jgi:hypothetical protein
MRMGGLPPDGDCEHADLNSRIIRENWRGMTSESGIHAGGRSKNFDEGFIVAMIAMSFLGLEELTCVDFLA